MNPTQHQTVIKFLPLFLNEEVQSEGEPEESAVQVIEEQPASVTDVVRGPFDRKACFY